MRGLGKEKAHGFHDIIGHAGPFTSKDPEFLGSRYNIRVKWDDYSETWEPTKNFTRDSPYALAEYARKHNLLDTDGWKTLKRYVNPEPLPTVILPGNTSPRKTRSQTKRDAAAAKSPPTPSKPIFPTGSDDPEMPDLMHPDDSSAR